MAINYTQAFNAGELSRNIDGRSDFEIYKIGCRDLNNFFVLPQGGVERRAGSEFIQFTGTDGSKPARMIEFDFSSDIRYVIELGEDYAKVHYEDDSGNNYVANVTGTINYTQAELNAVQFNRRYDTLILTCPTKPPQIFKRTTLTPTFTIEEIEYIYPPLQEKNITTINIGSDVFSISISSASLASNVVTVNTASAHNSVTGEYLTIEGLTGTTDPNGTHQITVVDADTFTFPLTGNDETYGVGGSPTVTNAYKGKTTLTSTSALFHKGHADSVWAIEHIRDGNQKTLVDSEAGLNTTNQSDAIDVSFCNWSFETSGTWVASVIIQRRIDGGDWQNYIVVGDTRGGSDRNFKTASDVPEDGNTELRVAYITGSGANMTKLEFSIEADNIYHKGLVEIDSVVGGNVVISSAALASNVVTINTATAHGLSTGDYVLISGLGYTETNPDIEAQITVTDTDTFTYALSGVDETFTTSASSHIEASSRAEATIVSMIQGGVASPAATIHWSEASFSDYRGFPPASEFFENRLWFSGSKDQPADLFASAFGDIYNFLSGELSTDAIKRTVDSPEEPKWLEGKRYLFLGTAGSAVSVRSADSDELITQNNITTLVENSYGSAPLQAEIANDVVIYTQRDRLKIRELVYDQNQDTFVGNDLNIVSEDITESGVKEMFVQKQPNQIVWCIKNDGKACAMTYERGQQIRGWSRIETDGEFISAASIHNGGEDTVWACVKRTTGEDTPVSKYCIEKFHPRKDLNWYIDSGKEITFGALMGEAKEATVNNIVNDDFLKFSITAHGYSDNDLVKLTNFSFSGYNNKTYKVVYIDTGSFFLKDQETDERLAITAFKQDYGAGTSVNDLLLRTGSGRITDSNTRWSISAGPLEYKPFTDNGNLRWGVYGSGLLGSKSTSDTTFPWEATYVNVSGTGALGFRFFDGDADTATVQKVASELDGLDHLEGKEVQVIVDDSFDSVQTVTNGKVTPVNSGTNIKAGLPYTSILRPMPIEPTLVNKISQSRVKAIAQIIVRFFKTKGASVGEQGKQLTTYSVADTQDPSGQAIALKTGQQRFFVASDYEREKVIEVRQDLPYPMTVLSIATHINAEGA